MRRAFPLLVFMAVSLGTLRAQSDPAHQLASLRASAAEVIKLGKAADRALIDARRALKVRAAIPVLRDLSKQLRKVDPADVTPEKAKEIVDRFAKELGEFVSLGETGIESAAAAASGAGESEKPFLSKVHSQLHVHVALTEITSYLEDGRNSGTFDGMYPETAKLGAPGAKAMVEIFTDIDLLPSQRQLAAEGVAQLGGGSDIPAVREIHDDELEDGAIRETCKFVIGRLGDLSLVNKEIQKLVDQIAQTNPKLEEGLKALRANYAKRTELVAIKEPTDEQKTELKTLEEKLAKSNQEVLNLFMAMGDLWNRRAVISQRLRKHAETETHYMKCLEYWGRVMPQMRRHPTFQSWMQNVYYNLACVQSLQGNAAQALASLDESLRWGYNDFKWMGKDGDLIAVRKLSGYTSLLEEVKSGKATERWKKLEEERMKQLEADAKKASEKAQGESKPDGD